MQGDDIWRFYVTSIEPRNYEILNKNLGIIQESSNRVGVSKYNNGFITDDFLKRNHVIFSSLGPQSDKQFLVMNEVEKPLYNLFKPAKVHSKSPKKK